MRPTDISIHDYTYDLPGDKIALHPLEHRDASKLLLYDDGTIKETVFSELTDHIPDKATIVFNNTKVINARLSFLKITGTRIEIFCLDPDEHTGDYQQVMATTSPVTWKCLVGGAAKWKSGPLEKTIHVKGQQVMLAAEKGVKQQDAYIVHFSWQPAAYSFAEILEAAGNVPLPPYIKRDAASEDTSRYQTLFAEHQGSVAAPTAGLHFTPAVFESLEKKSIKRLFVTLHVGAGTFKPVKSTTMEGHDMHAEYIDVPLDVIREFRHAQHIVAVGTTSLRTMETLYWLGVKAYRSPHATSIGLQQWDAYDPLLFDVNLPVTEALNALIRWLELNKLQRLITKTQLLIVPGYRFRMADMLITNFHQPESTLLLLVAAAIGNDWKRMYTYALAHDFRFLSYGDANLIRIKK